MHRKIVLVNRPTGMAQNADFECQTSEIPQVAEGEVLVEISHISLDPAMRGWMNEGFTYINVVKLGAVMRAFAVGTVIASKNADFPIGQSVAGIMGVQSHFLSSGKHLHKIDTTHCPATWYLGLLGMPGMTAYFGILDTGELKSGDAVFISGASGMVGSLVGQIAKIHQCKVVGSASTQEKCDYLTQTLGFDAAINYREENLYKSIKSHFPEGIDVFFDNVGGEVLDASLANLAMRGRIVICGAISMYNSGKYQGPKNYMSLLTSRGKMQGMVVFDYQDRYPEAVAQIAQWANEGKIHYREHIEHGLERYVEVLNMLYTSKNFGKLVLAVD